VNRLRSLLHDLTPPLLRRGLAALVARRAIRGYEIGLERPWSPSYYAYRAQRIAEYLDAAAFTQGVVLGKDLPDGHGRRLDERCVELPWVVGHLRSLPSGSRVLDAGSALNHAFVLDAPVFSCLNLHIATLHPEKNCFWDRGISYLFVDLQELPIVDAHYDLIMCVSTLEHVGFDNSLFGAPESSDGSDAHHRAIRELARVLRPGATLLLTVPFGRYERHRTFQQFDEATLQRAIAAFGPADQTTVEYFRYTPTGWVRSGGEDCAEAAYVPWIMQRADERERCFPIQTDGAIAARAVACVRLVKPRR
jgi:SAM-dependent methyltransferase